METFAPVGWVSWGAADGWSLNVDNIFVPLDQPEGWTVLELSLVLGLSKAKFLTDELGAEEPRDLLSTELLPSPGTRRIPVT